MVFCMFCPLAVDGEIYHMTLTFPMVLAISIFADGTIQVSFNKSLSFLKKKHTEGAIYTGETLTWTLLWSRVKRGEEMLWIL